MKRRGIGDFTLWVHYGPQASLAATILGTPPPELKNVFARENELIHQEFAGALASFNGDASIFDGARPHLQNCLLGQTERPQKQSAWWLAALAVVLIVVRRDRVLRNSPEHALEPVIWRSSRASRELWSPARRNIGDTTP